MGRYGLPLSFDDEAEKDDDDDEEPPHPLPFVTSPSWGRTRFSLYPPRETYPQLQERYYGETVVPIEEELLVLKARTQQCPSLRSYYDSSTASASAMMEYRHEQPRDARDDGIDEISRLLSASTLLDDPAKHVHVQNEVGQKLKVLAATTSQEYHKLDQWRESYQKKRDRQHKESFSILRSILKADHEAARAILQLEKQEKKEAEDRARQQEDDARRELDAQKDARQKEKDAIDQEKIKLEEKRQQRSMARAALERQEAEKMSYVGEAKELVNKLVNIRSVVQPFDVNKSVSGRRMNMKKLCRGRVNTLAAEVGKVQSVAAELIAAIKAEKELDLQMEALIQQGNRDVSPDMAKGQLYFMDLLASSALVRIQAEGFNGTRGDGFPLAAFLAIVSSEIDDFATILEAHIYSVCPTAIPVLPKPDKDSSESALMESLGMAKNKTGEFESFERFLQRTEGLVSMVADIMSSHPENHLLFGGHKSAITWLKRFMAMLPPIPQQLPLNTAPVLNAFLTGAGHMLANLYADEFKEILNIIATDTIARLDEGSVGAPGAHRLKETIKGGFDGFRQNLPSRALDSLYNDGVQVRPQPPLANSNTSTFGSLSTTSNPFASKPTYFGTSPFGQTSGDNPMVFNGQGNQASAQFGGVENEANADSGMMDSSTIIVGGNTFGGQPSPFNSVAPAISSPFGAIPTTNALFGTTAAASTPFGAPQAMQTPFGAAPSTSSPFGAPQTSQSPFGGAASTSMTVGLHSGGAPPATSTPFGSTQSGALPFGSSSVTPPAPFGAPQAVTLAFGSTSNSTLFGAPQSAPTPFGAPAAAQTPFGSIASGPTPFSTNQTPFGVPPSNPSPFGGASNITQSPFGGGTMASSPFAANSQQSTPFGGPFGSAGAQPSQFSTNSVQNSSAFGGQTQNSPFSSNFSAPMGTQKAPCKFFAQGNCRYGENCRFSHDAQSAGGGNAGGFGFGQRSDFGNSPFGGPRR